MTKSSSLNHNKTRWSFVSIISIDSCPAWVTLDCCLHCFVAESIPSRCWWRISFSKTEDYLASSTSLVTRSSPASWDSVLRGLSCIALTSGSPFGRCWADRRCTRRLRTSWKDCKVLCGLYYCSSDNAMTFLCWHSMMWLQMFHNICECVMWERSEEVKWSLNWILLR